MRVNVMKYAVLILFTSVGLAPAQEFAVVNRTTGSDSTFVVHDNTKPKKSCICGDSCECDDGSCPAKCPAAPPKLMPKGMPALAPGFEWVANGSGVYSVRSVGVVPAGASAFSVTVSPPRPVATFQNVCGPDGCRIVTTYPR